jgi:hypothetical protein
VFEVLSLEILIKRANSEVFEKATFTNIARFWAKYTIRIFASAHLWSL